jgi:hypothetical protein
MDILNLYIMFVKKKKILLRLRNLINIVPKYGHLKSLYCVCQKKKSLYCDASKLDRRESWSTENNMTVVILYFLMEIVVIHKF